MKRCARCDGEMTIARGRTASGGWQVFPYCFTCNHRNGTDSIPHRKVGNLEGLPIAWDNISQQARGNCATCFRDAQLEYHHVAPRHLFGEEAELWPGVMLCRTCHERWHRMVTPLMSMPTAVSEILAALPEESPIAKALRKAQEETQKTVDRKIPPERAAAWRERRAKAERGSAA